MVEAQFAAANLPTYVPQNIEGVGTVPIKAETVFTQQETSKRPTTSIRDYEYAKSQGYKGTLAEFKKTMAREGATRIGLGELGERKVQSKEITNTLDSLSYSAIAKALPAPEDIYILPEYDSLEARYGDDVGKITEEINRTYMQKHLNSSWDEVVFGSNAQGVRGFAVRKKIPGTSDLVRFVAIP